jgi:hypothetical protein
MRLALIKFCWAKDQVMDYSPIVHAKSLQNYKQYEGFKGLWTTRGFRAAIIRGRHAKSPGNRGFGGISNPLSAD